MYILSLNKVPHLFIFYCYVLSLALGQENVQKPSAEMYLIRYGYLPLPPKTNISSFGRSMVLDPTQVKTAITTFQQRNRLKVTGVLDASTRKKLASPRCGVSDMQGRSMFGKWPKMNLKYKFVGPLTNDLPDFTVRRAIKEAFQYWEKETPLTFVEVFDRERADFNMEFLRWDHGDGYPFDGRDGTLAHAFFPTDGRLHFDDDEIFTEEENRGYNLRIVAAHEIGHALGLPHSNDPDALMAAYYAGYVPRDRPLLNLDDIFNIQAIYGKFPNVTTSTETITKITTPKPTIPKTESTLESTLTTTKSTTPSSTTTESTTPEPSTTTQQTTTIKPTTTTEPTTTAEPTTTMASTTTEPTTTAEPTTTKASTTTEPTTTAEPTTTTEATTTTETTTTAEPTTTTEATTTKEIPTEFWTPPPEWPKPTPGPNEPDLCSSSTALSAAFMGNDGYMYLIIRHNQRQLLYRTEMSSSLVEDRWPINFHQYFKQDMPLISASLFVMLTKTFYFFSGTKMYQYSMFGYFVREEDIGKEVIAAFNMQEDKSILVTKDNQAWNFNPRKSSLESPQPLSSLISGLPSDIDAAAEDYPWSQDIKFVFFFKGRKYYKYDLVKKQMVTTDGDLGNAFFGCKQYPVPKFKKRK